MRISNINSNAANNDKRFRAGAIHQGLGQTGLLASNMATPGTIRKFRCELD